MRFLSRRLLPDSTLTRRQKLSGRKFPHLAGERSSFFTIGIQLAAVKYGSVPLRRLFKTNFDDLSRIRDVEPAAVRFPSFCNHLDQGSPQRGIRNMGESIAVCFHVEFQFLVLL